MAIETSCDDTSVSVVSAQGFVHFLETVSQDSEHAPFGGIVPEIAFRNHSLALLPMVARALEKFPREQIRGIAVTNRPGLIGSLIVGIVTTKSLAQAWEVPFLGVDHLEAHLWAPFLRDSSYLPAYEFEGPAIALTISGGHTSLYKMSGLGDYKVLGSTRDDAAGEAFDKFAKMLGLGFPGGKQVDFLSREGDPKSYCFPRAMIHDKSFDMSFSGLKTAAHRIVESLSEQERKTQVANLCASYQEALVDVLVAKLEGAASTHKAKRIILTGGVSANQRLREQIQELAVKRGYQLVVPPLRYCTDNAAMIGFVGALRMERGEFSPMCLGPHAQNS